MSLIRGDARFLPLRDGCVQCVVTSPPYWGLRDYGAANQIGLEATPDAYVASLVAVFSEARRVLKDDGTLWLNLGDSYANDAKWGGSSGGKHVAALHGQTGIGRQKVSTGLKAKDLVGIPWMVAFALRADGWYLRSDIIWSKPNPMPEPVTDRPTKAHEYLFLLSKSERYYYNAAAIFEPYAESTLREIVDGYDGEATKDYAGAGLQNPSDVKRRIIAGARRMGFGGRANASARSLGGTLSGNEARDYRGAGSFVAAPSGRNKRTVWTIPTMPFTGWSRTSRQVRVSWDESVDDTTRTTSPDCPVHGDRAVLAAKVLCGEHAAGAVTNTGHIGGGHASAPLLDSVPIAPLLGDCSEAESLDSSGQSHEQPAMPRSKGSRKTARARLTTSPCNAAVGTPVDTDDRSIAPPSSGADSRTLENSTAERDGQAVAALAESLGCTVGTCSCLYYRTITENTSHFATMPEALVEPCILAGCPLGGLVLDPFVGSGTVISVAERLGRRGVGVDLSYQDLAKKRTAQRGLRFSEASA